MKRTKFNKKQQELEVILNPQAVARKHCMDSFYFFFLYFWPEFGGNDLINNWHIKYLCDELQEVAEHRATKQPKKYDVIINIPPGTSKTSIVTIAFPAWCWIRYHWMRFITAGYSSTLSLESAEASRDLIRSNRFKQLFPELQIKDDKDVKSNFRVEKKVQVYKGHVPRIKRGGNRFSTSVGATITGFHGDIIIIDDPLNPEQAASEVQLKKANRWCDKTLNTRKTDKKATVIIYVMQRLHEDDPSGHKLAKKKNKVKHICLPAEIKTFGELLQPKELEKHYVDGLLDANRMGWEELKEMETDLGENEYNGQFGQSPTPPGGLMFEVDKFQIVRALPDPQDVVAVVRYWDKAGTPGSGAYTAGVKQLKLKDNRTMIINVERGQWGATKREQKIKNTAQADSFQQSLFGKETNIWIEQEPGSGGKESAENTIRNLAGFVIQAEHPTGDKVVRATPYSIQVNSGNVMLLEGPWNKAFIDEHEKFPFGKYKDQVDAAAAGHAKLMGKRVAKKIV